VQLTLFRSTRRAPSPRQGIPPGTRRRWLTTLAMGLIILAVSLSLSCRERNLPVTGIVWQLDNATVAPHGTWEQLGVRQLLIQWSAVDGAAFVQNGGLPTYPILPDWLRIAQEPWASEVILGLAGYFDESTARTKVSELVEQSLRLAQAPTPLKIVGWYFPVEVDPTWAEAPALAPLLARLPRPLWISVYDTANVGAQPLANWLASWLPSDVGVLFQDGVGVYARDAKVARDYADVLAKRLGSKRVRMIAEAFRPLPGGGFRAATAAEIAPQITAYRGLVVYLFDGPHYVSNALVAALVKQLCPSGCAAP
jgi:hypothetical protein